MFALKIPYRLKAHLQNGIKYFEVQTTYFNWIESQNLKLERVDLDRIFIGKIKSLLFWLEKFNRRVNMY